jgi:hypothetical protein
LCEIRFATGGSWLEEGDFVQLKSGGPKMIVDRVVHYSQHVSLLRVVRQQQKAGM